MSKRKFRKALAIMLLCVVTTVSTSVTALATVDTLGSSSSESNNGNTQSSQPSQGNKSETGVSTVDGLKDSTKESTTEDATISLTDDQRDIVDGVFKFPKFNINTEKSNKFFGKIQEKVGGILSFFVGLILFYLPLTFIMDFICVFLPWLIPLVDGSKVKYVKLISEHQKTLTEKGGAFKYFKDRGLELVGSFVGLAIVWSGLQFEILMMVVKLMLGLVNIGIGMIEELIASLA